MAPSPVHRRRAAAAAGAAAAAREEEASPADVDVDVVPLSPAAAPARAASPRGAPHEAEVRPPESPTRPAPVVCERDPRPPAVYGFELAVDRRLWLDSQQDLSELERLRAEYSLAVTVSNVPGSTGNELLVNGSIGRATHMGDAFGAYNAYVSRVLRAPIGTVEGDEPARAAAAAAADAGTADEPRPAPAVRVLVRVLRPLARLAVEPPLAVEEAADRASPPPLARNPFPFHSPAARPATRLPPPEDRGSREPHELFEPQEPQPRGGLGEATRLEVDKGLWVFLCFCRLAVRDIENRYSVHITSAPLRDDNADAGPNPNPKFVVNITPASRSARTALTQALADLEHDTTRVQVPIPEALTAVDGAELERAIEDTVQALSRTEDPLFATDRPAFHIERYPSAADPTLHVIAESAISEALVEALALILRRLVLHLRARYQTIAAHFAPITNLTCFKPARHPYPIIKVCSLPINNSILKIGFCFS